MDLLVDDEEEETWSWSNLSRATYEDVFKEWEADDATPLTGFLDEVLDPVLNTALPGMGVVSNIASRETPNPVAAYESGAEAAATTLSFIAEHEQLVSEAGSRGSRAALQLGKPGVTGLRELHHYRNALKRTSAAQSYGRAAKAGKGAANLATLVQVTWSGFSRVLSAPAYMAALSQCSAQECEKGEYYVAEGYKEGKPCCTEGGDLTVDLQKPCMHNKERER